MRSKLSQALILSALLTVVPWTVGNAYSGQNDRAIADHGRDDRGNTRDSRVSGARRSASEREYSRRDDEWGPRTSTRLLREIEFLEQQCLDEVNRVRRSKGLSRLEVHDELLPVAREYSRRMAEERFFSHTDPEGRTVKERVDEADIRWRMLGENLAYSNGYVNPVAASMRGWMDSPGHRGNILDPGYRLTAIGAWIASDGTVYFTEIFLKQ